MLRLGTGTAEIPSAVAVEAQAGQVVDLTLSFTRRHLELRITDADGSPVGDRLVSLRVDGFSDLDWWSPALNRIGRTDPRGHVVFPTAPPFACEVLVWNAGIVRTFPETVENGEPRCVVLGPLTPTEGVESVIELRLPR